jgi:hypothetical protein
MILAAAALMLGSAQPAAFPSPPCKDLTGKVIPCPVRKAVRKPCKPSKLVKCTKVTDYSGRVSYKW